MSTDQKENDIIMSLNGFYIINCPPVISPNSTYCVSVSVLDVTESCKFTFELEELKLQQEGIVVEPNTTKNVEFMIPENIADQSYKLTVKGTEGLVFSDSTVLSYHNPKPSVFVQTDKATYKPADTVQFRVLFLNSYLLPAVIGNNPILICINDTDGNRMKQFEPKTLDHGVFTGTLPLSEFPVLGDWSILVHLNGEELQRKSFTIDKYVLPNVEVTIDAPKKVSLAEEIFSIVVNARYTYGQFVKGKVTVVVSPEELHSYALFRRTTSDEGDELSKKNEKAVEKCVPINGKAVIDFDMAHFRNLDNNDIEFRMTVNVTMEEELTGKTYKANSEISLYRKRFIINTPHSSECKEEKELRSTKKYPYTITVTNLNDEPVHDTKHPVRVTQELFNTIIFGPVELYLNELGQVTVDLPAWKPGTYTQIRVEYLNHIENGSYQLLVLHEEHQIGVSVKNEKVTLGSNIDLELRAEDPLSNFVCTIANRNRIIKTEVIRVQESKQKVFKWVLPTSFDYMPNATVHIHYIKDKELISYNTKFQMEKEFHNKLCIEAPEETQPGDDVELQIKTQAESFVGLLGVDESVLLLKGGNDLEKHSIWNCLEQGCRSYNYYHNSMLTLTNANQNRELPFHAFTHRNYEEMNVMAAPAMFGAVRCKRAMKQVFYDGGCAPPPPRIRKVFLESWIFDDIHVDSNDFKLKKVMPDTITSWVITGFAVHPTYGFALTEKPTKIKTFRPFFITTNLPYAIKRGEVVSLPIIVFNYTNDALDTEVLFEENSNDFELMNDTHQALEINGNSGETVTYVIKPKRAGYITLKVQAFTKRYSDAIHKELKVVPEGITIFKNYEIFMDTKCESAQESMKNVYELEIPEIIVPESEHIEVSVMGDILGSTITNLDKLVRMPCGCGEQNMVNFVPNILVLDYLETTQNLTKTIENKAKSHLNIGYQRELTYRHDDGSYSAFGKSDKAGSTWLTAYVIRSFIQASKYIDIDENVLKDGIKFLFSKQELDGSFQEHGRLLDFSHLNKFGMTAYVLIALIDYFNFKKACSEQEWISIDNGINYLKNNIDECKKSHPVAIAVYALNLRDKNLNFMNKLDECVKTEGNFKWWSMFPKPDAKDGKDTKEINDCKIPIWCIKDHNSDIEITSYALMTLLNNVKNSAEALPIIKWLISKRNSNGGFSSTQDTVVGLQALILFAKMIYTTIGNFEVQILKGDDNTLLGKLQINKANALVVQSVELPHDIRKLKYEIKGEGSGLLQVAYHYNILEPIKGPSFELSIDTVRDNPNTLKLTATANYLLNTPSNMTVMEINLPSGFKVVTDELDTLQGNGIENVEVQNEDTKVIIYFTSFSENTKRIIEIYGNRTHFVTDQKPTSLTIYDYYNKSKEATIFYTIG